MSELVQWRRRYDLPDHIMTTASSEAINELIEFSKKIALREASDDGTDKHGVEFYVDEDVMRANVSVVAVGYVDEAIARQGGWEPESLDDV